MWQYNTISNDELYHYGILGMKWGRRKARNTSTPTTRIKRKKTSADYDTVKALRKKKTKQLSNEEIQKINNRMNLENQYAKLKHDRRSINKGAQFCKNATYVMGAAIGLYVTSGKFIETGKKILGK